MSPHQNANLVTFFFSKFIFFFSIYNLICIFAQEINNNSFVTCKKMFAIAERGRLLISTFLP